MADDLYRGAAARAANRYGIPKQLFMNLVHQESGWNPRAQSPAGAIGLTQLTPTTAQGLRVNPHDPLANLEGGARYLREQYDRFGSWQKALAAYNAGPGAVESGGWKTIPETQQYVKNVLFGSSTGRTPPVQPRAGVVAPAQQQPLAPDTNYYAESALLGGLGQIAATGQEDSVASLASMNQGMLADAMLNQQLAAQQPQPKSAASKLVTAPPLSRSLQGGGFLPQGASYQQQRADQGRDFQTSAGGPIVAPGDGYVVAVKSDPHGFGPSYPIVRFTSGPYKDQTLYIGHTLSVLQPGARFGAGQVISHTGTGRVPIGNATKPGWAEIGYAPGGAPGRFGQKTPF